MVFGLPWSHAFFYIGLVGMLFCLALSTEHYKQLVEACKHNVSLLALLLFTFVAAGMLYTDASYEYGMFDVKKYRKLLLVPVFLLLYRDLQGAKRLVVAYSLGVFFLILPTLIDGTGLMKLLSLNVSKFQDGTYSDKSLVYWRNHIVNGFHASILFVICVFSAARYRQSRWLCIPVAALCVLDIVFFIHGRAALIGLLAVCLLMSLGYIRRLVFRFALVLGLVAASALAYQASEKMQARVNSVVNEASGFAVQGDIHSSGGTRLHYWGMSLTLFSKNPIFGAGPGSFRKSLDQPENPLRALPHRHAHNEYLTLLSQHGLVGFILFLCLVRQIYKNAQTNGDPWLKGIVLAGLVVFLVNAATDSSLHNESEGWTFVMLACLACVTPRPTDEKVKHG